MNNLRVWQNKLGIADLRKHASDPDSYGIRNPAQNAYLLNSSINTTYVPNKETLLLHWNYDNVTGSDASGEFIVEDLTSGSATQINRYGWLSELNKQQYLGKGYDFVASSTKVCLIDEIATAKQQLPEVLGSDDMITVIENDDIYYSRDSRPAFFDMYAEKSPYQNISDDIMKFMSTVVEFNNIIGHPVHRYRHEYKPMNILRELFFQRIEDAPNVDKYIEYFKWFDIAVTSMIQKIAPMSSGLDERPLRTVIESHILERNKYQSKFPSYEFKQSDPQASLLGVAGMLYDWKHGHAPISEDEDENCFWWKDRAPRSNPIITSGDANVDSNRNTILEIINNQNNASAPNLSGSSGAYEGSTYAIRKFARPYKLNVDAQKQIHGGTNFNRNRKIDYWQSENRVDLKVNPYASVVPSDYVATSSCDDVLAPNQKESRFFSFLRDGITSDITSPFNLVSASTNSSAGVYGATDQFEIVNLHYDTYGYAAETPMQSPFTDAQVGGHQRRHVPFSTGSDSCVTRPELFRIHTIDGSDYLWVFSSDQTPGGGLGTNMPRAEYYRDGIAKRPVNIANINYNTGSRILGNYSKGYEIVMTNGRSVNNRFLAESTGQILTASADNYYVSGAVDFALPRRDLTGSNKYIIANRFSAPGDPATMAEGMLDVEAGEYSVYNALPWRNLSVRQPLNELQADHCKQFGYFSDAYDSASWAAAIRSGFKAAESYPGTSGSVSEANYNGSASFHKVNRNGRLQPYLSENSLDTYTNTLILYYDGSSNGWASIGNAATWNALIGNDLTGETDQTYTFSAWIHPTQLNHAAGNNEPRIFDFGATDIAFYLDTAGKLYFINTFSDAIAKWKTTDNVISINQWFHVAATYDATSSESVPKIYVDGYEVAVTEITTPQGTNSGITTEGGVIGNRFGIDRAFKGYIDEPSVWGAVLTPSQIEEIYLGSANYVYRSGPGRLNKHSAASSLISWWRVDGSTGITLNDDYGSPANDGTLQNSAMLEDNDGSAVSILQPVITYAEQTNKKHDNWFVQHQIPQTDLQYAWITASIVSDYNGAAKYGYEKPDFSNASLASTDLTFCSASDFVVYNTTSDIRTRWGKDKDVFAAGEQEVTPVDFVGLNTAIYDPLTASSNTLGYDNSTTTVFSYVNKTDGTGLNGFVVLYPVGTGEQSTLNGILLNRQGPYGAANWKLYRKEAHPIVRAHREENRISYLEIKKGTATVEALSDTEIVIHKTDDTVVLTSSIEPMITSKYKPLRHKLAVKLSPEKPLSYKATTIEHTYMNNINYFTDHSVDGFSLDNKILDPSINVHHEGQTLDAINYYLYTEDFAEAPQYNPIAKLISYSVSETVFPKEQYTYLSKIRGRENFVCPFWRETHAERLESNVENSMGYVIPTQSMWALDARLNYAATALTGGFDGAGTLLSNGIVYLDHTGNHFVGPIYTTPTSSSGYGPRNDRLWVAGEQSGVDPFASSYAAYALEMQKLGKDFGIIPEFRISEYICDYIDTGFDINAKNPNQAGKSGEPFLSLTGSALDNTDPAFYKTYSNSDFLKYFAVRNTENDLNVGAGTVISGVKLKCKAMMKFLPYEGFYPVQRTLQIAELFSASYLVGLSSGSARAGLTPFFAPGIMYNSIKAGMAVDYPMPTGSILTASTTEAPEAVVQPNAWKYFSGSSSTSTGQHFTRIPFESILDLNSSLPIKHKWKDHHINPGSTNGNKTYTLKTSDGNKSQEYILATNNFFAETINFFLPGGNMTRIVSLPAGDPGFGNSQTTIMSRKNGTPVPKYKMRVIIANTKTVDTTLSFDATEFYNYGGYQSFGIPIGSRDRYSAYVPPYAAAFGHASSQAPYTGFGWVEFEWSPENPSISDEYTLDNILNTMTSSFWNWTDESIQLGEPRRYMQMQISASFNMRKGKILATEYNAVTKQATSVSDNNRDELEIMVIEPKWECPQLNFSGSNIGIGLPHRPDYTTTTWGSNESVMKGMWHQKGVIEEQKGVFLTVTDSDDVDGTNVGSLADLMGFDQTGGKTAKRLGKIAGDKEISEAVVAIPYKRKDAQGVPSSGKVPFPISRKVIQQAEQILKGATQSDNPLPDNSIIQMVRKMKRYVIPPHLDFVTYGQKPGGGEKTDGPFAMYIFEFKHKLTQQDLANIWQNLPPTSMGAAPYYHESDEVTISHEVFNSSKLNILNGALSFSEKNLFDANSIDRSREIAEDIHWMVFKVKKRAATNYYDKITNLDDGEFDFKFANQDTGFPNITYNWPYDYFSMVELVKLDAEIVMQPNDGSAVSTPQLTLTNIFAGETETTDEPPLEDAETALNPDIIY